jgi:hypothetical protein
MLIVCQKDQFLKEFLRYFPSECCSGSRGRDVVETRGSISWTLERELGYSGADVPRYLGVTNSCVSRFVASDRKPDVDDLIKNL